MASCSSDFLKFVFYLRTIAICPNKALCCFGTFGLLQSLLVAIMTSHSRRNRTVVEKIEILDAVENSKPVRTNKNCKATGRWVNDAAKMTEGGKGITNRVGKSSARQK